MAPPLGKILDPPLGIVRYYGGQHLGNKHFQIVQELTKQAIKMLKSGAMHKSTLPLRCLLNPQRRTRRRSVHTHKQQANAHKQTVAKACLNRFGVLNQRGSENNPTQSDASELYSGSNSQEMHPIALQSTQPKERWTEYSASAAEDNMESAMSDIHPVQE